MLCARVSVVEKWTKEGVSRCIGKTHRIDYPDDFGEKKRGRRVCVVEKALSKPVFENPRRERPHRAPAAYERVHSKTARTMCVLARKTHISAQFSRILPRASFATRPNPRVFSSRGGKAKSNPPPPLSRRIDSFRIQNRTARATLATRRAIPRWFDIVRILFLRAKKEQKQKAARHAKTRCSYLFFFFFFFFFFSLGDRASGA